MKKTIAIFLGLGLLTAWNAPAFPQEQQSDDPIALERKQKQRDNEELDKRYKATLQKTRKDGPAERIDPWANMRSNADPKK